jgi:AcrR family transcriptional regulator
MLLHNFEERPMAGRRRGHRGDISRHGRGDEERGDRTDPRVAKTKERVVSAGRALLDEEGPDAVTHLRIGEETGIARTTIYRHWPDRGSLLAAVLAEAPAVEAELDRGDVRADLHAYFEMVRKGTGRRRDRHGMAHAVARAEHDRSFAAIRRERVERRIAPLREVLRRAVDRGELDASLDVEERAIDLIAPVFFRRFFLGEALDDDRIDTLIDVFMDRHGI